MFIHKYILNVECVVIYFILNDKVFLFFFFSLIEQYNSKSHKTYNITLFLKTFPSSPGLFPLHSDRCKLLLHAQIHKAALQ